MKIIFFTGAGMSVDSGIRSLGDPENELARRYDLGKVITIEGFNEDPDTANAFYNELRHQINQHQPNQAHLALAQLEEKHDVQIVTMNVDNLHERAGSKHVFHVHGELMKARTLTEPYKTYDLPSDQLTDKGLDLTSKTRNLEGEPVRTSLVLFGEPVPAMNMAKKMVEDADVIVIIGTKLNVQPIASVVLGANPKAATYYIDPNPADVPHWVHVIHEPVSQGLPKMLKILEQL